MAVHFIMRMSMFFKDRKTEKELQTLFQQKNYDGVISKINSVYGGKSLSVKFEKQLALAYYYKGDYENSLKHFESVAEKDRTTQNLFNVMTSLFALKKTDAAREIFDEMIKNHRGLQSTGTGKNFLPQLCVPYLRFYYANGLADAGEYAEAEIQLEELKNVYVQVKITDGTFLYIRGIPFLGSTLELAKKVYEKQEKDFANSDFLNEIFNAVDTDGRNLINKQYKS